MLIKNGFKHKKVLGIKRRIKAPVYGATTAAYSGDFNLDSGLSNPNQNQPNPQWDAPAYPEGCTYYAQTEVCQDADKTLYSPVYQGENSCFMENQPMGSPVDVTDALNTPTVYGLQGFGEPTNVQALTRKRVAQEVQPINGSLYQGILQALQSGQSVSYFGTWYESWDNSVNTTVLMPSGQTSSHNWKFCGVKDEMLIGKPWLGWFSYFPKEVVDTNGGQAFTFIPGENTELVVYEAIVTTLIKYLQRLASFGGTQPVFSLWTELEDEINSIEQEIRQESMFTPMIEKWATIIAKEEGAQPDSNNPGNLKYSTLTASWGATKGREALDGGFLCQFLSYQGGFNALCNFLTLGCEDELVAFHSPEARTLQGFTVIYAGNPPQGYIDGIINGMGVPGDTQISTFLA